jgi:hypothetical protein
MRAWIAIVSLVSLAAGCGDTMISVSSDGRIDVAVSTTGTDVDDDGFTVNVDGGVQQFLPSGGQVTLSQLEPGSHSVRLSGLAPNCQVVGSNPRSVQVGADGRATVAFEVSCVRATTGGFRVIVVTAGEPADTDGYLLAVAGADEIRPIGPNATETFVGLAAGLHLVTLKDVDEGCALAGGNPQPFTVVPGKTVPIHLSVSCGSLP